MANVPMSGPLRLILLADAGARGATAALLVAAAGLLERLLGLPVALMHEAGTMLIPTSCSCCLSLPGRPLRSLR